MIAALKRTLNPIIKNRKARVYSIGIERSGTASIPKYFPQLRAMHEPNVRQLWNIVCRQRRGQNIKKDLRRRDSELYLELESCHLTAHVAAKLTTLFPNSKFICTVREPLSWLRSVIQRHTAAYSVKHGFWKPILDFYYGTKEKYQYSWTKKQGIYPVRSYLRGWVNHNEIVLSSVPPNRLIVVWTSELSDKVRSIEDFVGSECIDRPQSHNSTSTSIDPYNHLPIDELKKMMQKICKSTIKKIRKIAV